MQNTLKVPQLINGIQNGSDASMAHSFMHSDDQVDPTMILSKDKDFY